MFQRACEKGNISASGGGVLSSEDELSLSSYEDERVVPTQTDQQINTMPPNVVTV